MTDDRKKIVQEMKENDKFLGSLCLRVNGKNLLNKRRENAKKEAIAQKIIASIMIRRSEKDIVKDNITIVPCFDIQYQEIFKEFIENDKKLTLSLVNNNFELIEAYFGFRVPDRTIEELNNQSMVPLEYIFADFVKAKDQIDVDGEKNHIQTVLDKQKQPEITHMVHYLQRNIENKENPKLMPGSDFFLKSDADNIDKYIPGYITAPGWKLVYSRRQHGTSYKT